MDVFIVLTAFTAFMVFFLSHLLIFRIIKQEELVKWLILLYTAVFLLEGVGVTFLLFPTFSISLVIMILILSLVLYTLLAFIYVLGILGVVTTSMRIRLLDEIVERGPEGLERGEILKIYNRDRVLKRRLSRLVAGGELIYKDGYYCLNRPFSYFIIHNLIQKVLKRLYLCAS